MIVEIDHDWVVFHFGEEFFDFASKKGDFRDDSTWKIVAGFEWLDSFGIVQVQFIFEHAINDNSIVWLMYFNSFEDFIPINDMKLFYLFFYYALNVYIISEFVDFL